MLRPYQTQALTALREAREAAPDMTRLAIEMATGLGKTVTMAAELDEWLAAKRDMFGNVHVDAHHAGRALVLVHLDHLVKQAVDTITFVTKSRWTVGVVKAGQNDVHADIIVASVQTLAQPGRKEQIQDVGKIIIDEAHHALARTYLDILEYYGALPCDQHGAMCHAPEYATPVTGYSATLARADGQGLGRVFQDMPFSRSLPWGVRHGYLLDFTPYTITIPGLDTAGSDTDLDTSLADSIAPEAVVDAWFEKVDYPGNTDDASLYRPGVSTVLFAPLVKSAQAFADAFNEAGVKAEVVSSSHPDAHNAAVLARYEAGVTTVLCNAMKLTEGWDSPRTMCVIVARPTQSISLFIQMIGRALRPWLEALAPSRDQQHAVLLCIQGTVQSVASVADLSDKIGEVKDGQSFLDMEDQWDIGRDIEPDETNAYAGPVRVEQWDAMVQASSKAWKYTAGGTPFLPTAKRSQGYVFVVDTVAGWEVWVREPADPASLWAARGFRVAHLSTAPDLELAMAAAEDEAQERGGDIGALLADKTRPWRKGVPSTEMQTHAQRLGLGKELIHIMEGRAAGKAGKLSDLISKVEASKVLDPNVQKIRERARA
jgi:superfamily II DNA or RNA helicase